MNKVKQGVWTPAAAVICVSCHGPKFRGKVFEGDQWEQMQAPVDLEPQNKVTFCDHCGESIQIEQSIACEHNLMKDIRNLGIYASLWQTGGMNSALGIEKSQYTEDEVVDEVIPHYLITYNFDGDGKYVIQDEQGNIKLSTSLITKVIVYIRKMKDYLSLI